MGLRESFKIVIDVATDGAQKSLKQLRKDVIEADGAFGKMRVASSGALDYLKQNAAAAALTAGTALVTFAVKAVQAFQDTALAAGQFSDATGIAVEDASRWVEVAGDFGIEAGAVQGAMQKMNKAIGDGKPVMDEFGDSIVRASDGTVDSAATFQNLVTKIGAIKDPTERAKAAQEAFGRSYGDIARFMEMSATDLASALGSVSDQKVIDQAELEKARKFQASMDELKDKIEDVTLVVGEEIVPVLSDMADKVSWVTDKISAVSGVIEDVTGSGLVEWIDRLANPLSAIGDAWDGLFGDDDADKVESVTTAIEHGTEAADEMAAMYAQRVPKAMDESTFAFDSAAGTANNLAIQTGIVERAAEKLGAEWDRLTGRLDEKQAWINLQTTFDDVREKGAAAMQAAADGAANAEQLMRDFQSSLLGAAGDVVGLGKELGLLPDQVSVLVELAENGQIDELERRLTILTRNRQANIDIIERGGAGYGGRTGNTARATGGPVQAGRAYVVGDNPDGSWNATTEMFIPDGPGRVLSPRQSRAAMAGQPSGQARSGDVININLHGSTVSAADVAREIAWSRMVG